METSAALREALGESQRLGFLGARPIPDVIAHARGFVHALEGVEGEVVDLGAGGGVPGLVIAHDRPDLHLVLVDRRTKRTDFLQRVVRRLRWAGRVDVVSGDVRALTEEWSARFDATVARGFGPPEVTLAMAIGVTRLGGRIVISEPPNGDRWSSLQNLRSGTVERKMGVDGVAVFEVRRPAPQ